MMVIDMTAQLAPVINGTVALLAVAGVAIFGVTALHWVVARVSSAQGHQNEVAADAIFRMAA